MRCTGSAGVAPPLHGQIRGQSARPLGIQSGRQPRGPSTARSRSESPCRPVPRTEPNNQMEMGGNTCAARRPAPRCFRLGLVLAPEVRTEALAPARGKGASA
jgi:hypothetical protein